MRRLVLLLSYKGTRYHGWQLQDNAVTVQAIVDQALSTLIGVAVSTTASGRTDTGVHAQEQYVHFDVDAQTDTSQWIYKLNGLLPPDISVQALYAAPPEFSTRFDALSRSYEYRMTLTKNPFLQGLSHRFTAKSTLNIGCMNQAAVLLLEHTDFQCFSKVHTEVYTFNCTITQAFWEERSFGLVFCITANRFLRGMVRAIVGTLLEVGLGKLSIEDFEAIIRSKDRSQAKRSVPPEGLFLTCIKYPDGILQPI